MKASANTDNMGIKQDTSNEFVDKSIAKSIISS